MQHPRAVGVSFAIVSLAYLGSFAITVEGQAATEAPAGFDNRTNGLLTQADFDAAKAAFEERDEIADGLAQGRAITLYRGPLVGYPLAILDLPSETSVPVRASSAGGRGGSTSKPYGYLSVVDGELARHATWADCERRVKGRPGARFKKAMSPEDEAAILREWRIKPDGR